MSVTTTPEAPPARPRRPAGAQPGRVGGGLLDPKMLLRSTPDAFKKLDPRVQIKNPVMFVVEVGAVLTLYTAIFKDTQPIFNWTIVVLLWLTVVFANLAEAVAEGRGKAQAETLRRTKRETVARRLVGWQPGQKRPARGDGARHPAHARRPRGRRGRRDHPRRRRRRRGHRLGGRVGDHRRVRAGDPRVRRRPVRGHRRHQGAVRPDRGADHLQAGRDLHRPDDRPGRGRPAAEDAERARAEHPARLADDHLHAGRGHAAADGVLLRRAADAWSSWSRCWWR